MLRQEIDVVAKAIRNSNCSLADKKDIVDLSKESFEKWKNK
jgi:hypothetical protein